MKECVHLPFPYCSIAHPRVCRGARLSPPMARASLPPKDGVAPFLARARVVHRMFPLVARRHVDCPAQGDARLARARLHIDA